eukprot:2388514-Rhodomonas_salina.3
MMLLGQPPRGRAPGEVRYLPTRLLCSEDAAICLRAFYAMKPLAMRCPTHALCTHAVVCLR